MSFHYKCPVILAKYLLSTMMPSPCSCAAIVKEKRIPHLLMCGIRLGAQIVFQLISAVKRRTGAELAARLAGMSSERPIALVQGHDVTVSVHKPVRAKRRADDCIVTVPANCRP